jgi:hypothetical protein
MYSKIQLELCDDHRLEIVFFEGLKIIPQNFPEGCVVMVFLFPNITEEYADFVEV